MTDSIIETNIQEVENEIVEEDTGFNSIEIPEEEIIVTENIENKVNTEEEEKVLFQISLIHKK